MKNKNSQLAKNAANEEASDSSTDVEFKEDVNDQE